MEVNELSVSKHVLYIEDKTGQGSQVVLQHDVNNHLIEQWTVTQQLEDRVCPVHKDIRRSYSHR